MGDTSTTERRLPLIDFLPTSRRGRVPEQWADGSVVTEAACLGYLYRERRMTGAKIAKLLEIPERTIYRWLRGYGIIGRVKPEVCRVPNCGRPVHRIRQWRHDRGPLGRLYMTGRTCLMHGRREKAQQSRDGARRRHGIPPERWRLAAL
jgi:hypothetical protein